MSYVRWSSIINADLTDEEWFKLYTSGLRLEEQLEWCKQNKTHDSYLSDW